MGIQLESPALRFIFLNGPPRSGKDTAARLLCELLPLSVHTKFAKALKEGTHALLGLPLVHDAFEHCKNEPISEFFGLSPREFYIQVSETFMKPLRGEEVFGEILLRSTESFGAQYIVVSNCGFHSETKPIINKVGMSNCCLIRLHRKGCNFSGDSRSHIQLGFDNTFDVHNNGTIDELQWNVLSCVKERWS